MKNGKLFFIAIIFLVSFLCISAASAADDAASDIVADADEGAVLEESIDDAVLEDGVNDELESSDEIALDSADDETLGVPAPGTFTDLNNLINGGTSDVVYISTNHYFRDSDSAYAEGIHIGRAITLEGRGYTIDGQNSARLFDVTKGGSLTLKNLNLVNGFSEWGGAINVYDGSSLTVINCTFSNNVADVVGSPQGGIHIPEGGAIYVKYNSICNIIDSRFEGNTAKASGGAICGCYNSDITINNSNFTNNGVIDDYSYSFDQCGGDAISIYSDTKLTISKSIFDTNNAGNVNIAAIKSFESSLTVRDSTFINNFGTYGGAMYGGTAINCTFTNNHAEHGGAMSGGTAINCTFKENNAVDGGAIYNTNAEGSTFIGNYADQEDGGAMYGGSAVNCTFTSNSANRNGGAMYGGSAINCIFGGNIGNENGGAIYNGNAKNCKFTNNEAFYNSGGAIYNVDATNCYFENNKAQYNGGGAMYGGSAVNCTFTANSASSGGAIYLGYAENCTFTNNGAEFRGGAMSGNYYTNERCYATNCIFSGNVAPTFGVVGDDNGGAIYLGAADSCVFNGDSCEDVIIYLPTLSVDQFTSTYNSGDKVIVNLKTHSGMPIVGAKIVISVYTAAGAFVGNYNALSNVGWKVPFNAGSYKATYIAQDFDIDSDQGLILINKAKSTITSKAVTAVYNNNKYLVITLKDNKGKALIGAKVTVTLASAKTYKTDKNGQIKINIGKLVPKSYTAKIKFAGNTNFLASSTTAKVTVKKATPKMTAKAKTFKVGVKTKKYTITLKNNLGKVMKSTKVTLTVNKKTYTVKTNSKGVATFKITNLKKKGKFTATIKYAGSKYYNKVTKKPVITVKK